MQFEMIPNVHEKVCKVTFVQPRKLKNQSWKVLDEVFQRLGAKQCDNATYLFPSFITSQVLKESIHNTCFVCGGLMQDGEAIQEGKIFVSSYDNAIDTYQGEIEYPNPQSTKVIKVRKCSSCGHSHT